MKKILTLILTVCMLCLSITLYVNAEHIGIQNTNIEEKQNVMKLLEIINGDETGNLNLDANVTRAEFVKMAITASVYKESAKSNSGLTLFPDVRNDHWAQGYISSAINAKLVTGYLDGTFKPDNSVKLEEAVIICLKLLGYTNNDFSGTYPDAQISKYKEIDLDTNINTSVGENLTRKECVNLFYNLLCTKNKNGVYYCSTLGQKTDSDNTIDYLSLLSSTLKGPVVHKNGYSWKEYVNFNKSIRLRPESAKFLLDGELISENDIKENDVIYYSEHLNMVWIYRDTKSGVCLGILPSKENPSSVNVGGTNYTLSTDKAKYLFSNLGTLSKDSFVTLILGKDGDVVDAIKADADIIGKNEDSVSFSEVVSSSLKGPFIVPADRNLKDDTEINAENATIYKNNNLSDVSHIKKYDVYYYSKVLNTVWLYDDTFSGTLENISTSGMQPTSVTVSGKTYKIETSDAQFSLSTLGNFKVGDKITLLLSKDKNVAGVIPAGIKNPTTYGIVLANGKGLYTDADGKTYTKSNVKILATDGNVYTYEDDGSYSVGKPVKITSSEDDIRIDTLAALTYSKASPAIEAIKNGKFASDAEIIDYYNENVYAPVISSRISGKKLEHNDIIHFSLDNDGKIKTLILDDYTGDLFEYGIVSVSYKDSRTVYKYLIDTEFVEFNPSSGVGTSSSSYKIDAGPAYFIFENGMLDIAVNLKTQEEIEYISGMYAYTEDDQRLEIASNVKIYVVDNGKYVLTDLDKFDPSSFVSVFAYLDNTVSNGGLIRVIVAL